MKWKQLVSKILYRGILGNLHVLIHEEEEADFWENIVHIQSSRRHKALLRLSRHSLPPLEESAISVLLPIIRSFFWIGDWALVPELNLFDLFVCSFVLHVVRFFIKRIIAQ